MHWFCTPFLIGVVLIFENQCNAQPSTNFRAQALTYLSPNIYDDVSAKLNLNTDVEHLSKQQVRALFNSMLAADQKYRDSINTGSKLPEKQQFFTRQIILIDDINQKLLTRIINSHGWPTPAKFGAQATEIAWLIVWHAPEEYKRKYIEIIKQAYLKGEIHPNYYHILREKLTR